MVREVGKYLVTYLFVLGTYLLISILLRVWVGVVFSFGYSLIFQVARFRLYAVTDRPYYY